MCAERPEVEITIMAYDDLDKLFAPQAIAVFGASDRPTSVAARVFRNLREGAYKGQIYAVNPRHKRVQHRRCYADLADLGKPVQLAVIATPLRALPEIIGQCLAHGVGVGLIMPSDLAGSGGEALPPDSVARARRGGLRLLGPDSSGVLRPELGLNASVYAARIAAGRFALVSESGALVGSILDWAEAHQVGFSAVTTLGDAADLDFSDLLGYLALDPHTRCILLYLERVREARRLLQGLRAATRMKPVIVLKSGRGSGASPTAPAVDAVLDVALERAGAVRVAGMEDLFTAASVLAAAPPATGERLLIITNTAGPDRLAADRASQLGLPLAALDSATRQRLEQALPQCRSGDNPFNILADATPERYAMALSEGLGSAGVDGAVVILSPETLSDPQGVAQAVVEVCRDRTRPVIACWMGEQRVREARDLFAQAGLPCYATPERAVEAYNYLLRHRRGQQLLRRAPGARSDLEAPDQEGARLIIRAALGEGRARLGATEAKAVLAAFRIPISPTQAVHSANEALVAAEGMGFPVVLKGDGAGAPARVEVDGPRGIARAHAELSLELPPAGAAATAGITVEHLAARPHARRLMAGITRDAAFGPVIAFGAGAPPFARPGAPSLSLPPLDPFLATHLVDRANVEPLLDARSGLPPVDRQALERVLLRLSEMACALPEIERLELNPLLIDEAGALAVDAEFTVSPAATPREPAGHLAIGPYPSHLVRPCTLRDGSRVTIRPVRPDDAGMERSFVHDLSREARYFRFMQNLTDLDDAMTARLTVIDYDKELALSAVQCGERDEIELGVARYADEGDGDSCEFAVVVADAWRRRGLASCLLEALMEAARERGYRTMRGTILASNSNMQALARKLGFKVHADAEDPGVKEALLRL